MISLLAALLLQKVAEAGLWDTVLKGVNSIDRSINPVFPKEECRSLANAWHKLHGNAAEVRKPNCCKWETIVCHDTEARNVRIVSWDNMNLHGSIHWTSLMELKHMQILLLSGNRLLGNIESLKYPLSLKKLDLSNNDLSGLVKYELGPGLSHLNLRGNRINGEFPNQLSNQLKFCGIDKLQFCATKGYKGSCGVLQSCFFTEIAVPQVNQIYCNAISTIWSKLGETKYSIDNGSNCCAWFGIECDGLFRVVKISWSNKLFEFKNTEIDFGEYFNIFTSLEVLDLSEHPNLSGSISGLKLPLLQSLYFPGNVRNLGNTTVFGSFPIDFSHILTNL